MEDKCKKGTWIDYLVYLVVRIMGCLVLSMRIETAHACSRRLAWFFCDVLKIRRGVVLDNLRHAFPEMTAKQHEEIMRNMWEHLFLLGVELLFSRRKIHETNWRDHVNLVNGHEIVSLLIDGRATLVVTAHYGNFEVGGYMMGLLGFPTYTVARTLDNPFLDEYLNDFRSCCGQRIIPKQGAFDYTADVLGSGHAMAFLADQYAGVKGCWVEFFGRQASAHKAIALLALENDATVVISGNRRLDNKPLQFELKTHASIDPRESRGDIGTIKLLTQWYTTRIEEAIREDPGQYWWLHRRWKDTREEHRAQRRKEKKVA